MKVTKISIAILFALISLTVFLPSAIAEEPTASEGTPVTVPEPGVILDDRYTLPGSNYQVQASGIRVLANAALSCDAGEGSPVMGARVTVFTQNSVSMAFTNQVGEALFGAVQGPALVQIEWPAGLMPCPNSPITAELPSGVGEVTFLAVPIR